MGLTELIRNCKNGDVAAQQQVYQMYAPKVYGICLKYCHTKAFAEDTLQDTFITVFEKIGQFSHKGSFEGWIKRIAVNTAMQVYRKKPKVFEIVDDNIPEEDENSFYIEDSDQYSLDVLLSVIQKLPNRYRLVFNLYVLDGYSHQEIAEMLAISVGTSKSNLSRARKILQQQLQSLPSQRLKTI